MKNNIFINLKSFITNYKALCFHWFKPKCLYWYENYGATFFFLYFLFRLLIKRKPSLILCNYIVTTNCTLKCKECCSFIPYYTEKGALQPVSFEQFKDELDKILSSVDLVYNLVLLGGEPLLVNDLGKMVKYALSKDQIQYVSIQTNGTILPSNELIEALKNHSKASVGISNYTSNENLKGKLKTKGICTLLSLKHIPVGLADEKDHIWHTKQKFTDFSKNSEKAKENYESKCGARYCTTFLDGKLYMCQVCAYIDRNIKKYKFEQNEYVDFSNSKNPTKDFITYLQKPYYEVCGVCKCEISTTRTARQIGETSK